MGGPAKGPATSAAGTPSNRRLEPGRVGLVLFISMEIMFFAGLISSFLVFRLGQWPPPDQPRLPVEMTALNTLVLLISALTFHLALKALKASSLPQFRKYLAWTAILGFTFLAVQGTEWIRLVRFGLTVHGSIFGGFFYCLIGTHGVHVAGGLVALLWVLNQAFQGAYSANQTLGVELCRMYWSFVVGLWPILFVLVYL